MASFSCPTHWDWLDDTLGWLNIAKLRKITVCTVFWNNLYPGQVSVGYPLVNLQKPMENHHPTISVSNYNSSENKPIKPTVNYGKSEISGTKAYGKSPCFSSENPSISMATLQASVEPKESPGREQTIAVWWTPRDASEYKRISDWVVKTIGKCWFHGILWDLPSGNLTYLWKLTSFKGKSHIKSL